MREVHNLLLVKYDANTFLVVSKKNISKKIFGFKCWVLLYLQRF